MKYCLLIMTLYFGMYDWQQKVVQAQEVYPTSRSYDTLIVSAVVVGKDTIPFKYLNVVNIYGEVDAQRLAELKRLRYNVTKVYPYALQAAAILEKVDEDLSKLNKKRDQKKYIKETQDALSSQFKDELKNLTVTQGQILVKLINRETGRKSYDIIRQLKGGLNARMYQTTAFFFSHNLKSQYDPFGEDADIEHIVKEIEPYFKAQRRTINISNN